MRWSTHSPQSNRVVDQRRSCSFGRSQRSPALHQLKPCQVGSSSQGQLRRKALQLLAPALTAPVEAADKV